MISGPYMFECGGCGESKIEIVQKFLNLKLLWTTCQADSRGDSTQHVNLGRRREEQKRRRSKKGGGGGEGGGGEGGGREQNIARGTTDPEIDSATWTKLGNNMAPLFLTR